MQKLSVKSLHKHWGVVQKRETAKRNNITDEFFPDASQGVDTDLFVFELEILQIQLAERVFVLICYKGRRKLFVWFCVGVYRISRENQYFYLLYAAASAATSVIYKITKRENNKSGFALQYIHTSHQSRTQPIICKAIKDS